MPVLLYNLSRLYEEHCYFRLCPSSPDGPDQLTATNWGNDGNYGYNYGGLVAMWPMSRADADIEKPPKCLCFRFR